MVVTTLGADLQILFEIGGVEHRFARRALVPQALGHRAAGLAGITLDLGRQQFG
jgi:hypothetical protein